MYFDKWALQNLSSIFILFLLLAAFFIMKVNSMDIQTDLNLAFFILRGNMEVSVKW